MKGEEKAMFDDNCEYHGLPCSQIRKVICVHGRSKYKIGLARIIIFVPLCNF